MTIDVFNTEPAFVNFKYFPCDLNEEDVQQLYKMNGLPTNTYIMSLQTAYEFKDGKLGKFIKNLDSHKLMNDIQILKN